MIDLNIGVPLTQTIITNVANTYDIANDNQTTVNGLTDEVDREFHHETILFPSTPSKTWILTAGAVNNAFSDWAQIVDNALVALSDSCIEGYNLHITGISIEDASAKDKIYTLELAYGATKTVITRGRFMSGNTKAGAANNFNVRAEFIPCGESMFYRLQCETGGATLQLHLRFHLDTI